MEAQLEEGMVSLPSGKVLPNLDHGGQAIDDSSYQM
jgi:hypothetical protein